MWVTLDHLRRYAIARSLFKPTTLKRAIDKLGFVQADPIRAPARAQDLTLRHRVAGYRAGDLERRYPKLPLEEDFFVNYGYMPRAHHQLMHPRTARTVWTPARAAQAAAVLEFIRARGAVHPREVDAHFAHGKVTNWFGGSSNASTELLDVMHYRGLLRVARREGGTRVYAARETAAGPDTVATPLDAGDVSARMDALVDVAVHKYAPLSASTLVSWSGICAAARRSGPRNAARRSLAPSNGLPTLALTASTGTGRPWTDRHRSVGGLTRACACSRPSTRSSGTVAASKSSGAGPIASRLTRPRRNANSATTHYPCCGTNA